MKETKKLLPKRTQHFQHGLILCRPLESRWTGLFSKQKGTFPGPKSPLELLELLPLKFVTLAGLPCLFFHRICLERKHLSTVNAFVPQKNHLNEIKTGLQKRLGRRHGGKWMEWIGMDECRVILLPQCCSWNETARNTWSANYNEHVMYKSRIGSKHTGGTFCFFLLYVDHNPLWFDPISESQIVFLEKVET